MSHTPPRHPILPGSLCPIRFYFLHPSSPSSVSGLAVRMIASGWGKHSYGELRIWKLWFWALGWRYEGLLLCYEVVLAKALSSKRILVTPQSGVGGGWHIPCLLPSVSNILSSRWVAPLKCVGLNNFCKSLSIVYPTVSFEGTNSYELSL